MEIAAAVRPTPKATVEVALIFRRGL